MNNQLTVDRSVLRWAGLAGIAGGIVFALTFAVVIAFALPDPGDPQALARFPDIRAARTLENGLYLVAVILWVPLFIALDRVLRQTSLAPALGGSVATLVLVWQANEGIFESLLTAGIVLVTAGLAALGVAMLKDRAFGKGIGWASVVLGLAGLAAACLALVDPGSPIVAAGFLAVMVFQLVAGWKAYRLSRTS